MSGSSGSRLYSAVPDLVLNLDVEQALLPLKTRLIAHCQVSAQ